MRRRRLAGIGPDPSPESNPLDSPARAGGSGPRWRARGCHVGSGARGRWAWAPRVLCRSWAVWACLLAGTPSVVPCVGRGRGPTSVPFRIEIQYFAAVETRRARAQHRSRAQAARPGSIRPIGLALILLVWCFDSTYIHFSFRTLKVRAGCWLLLLSVQNRLNQLVT